MSAHEGQSFLRLLIQSTSDSSEMTEANTWTQWFCSWIWDGAPESDRAGEESDAATGALALGQLPFTDASLLAEHKLIVVLAQSNETRKRCIDALRRPSMKFMEFGTLTTVREFAATARQAAKGPVQVAWNDAQLRLTLSRKLKRDVRASLQRVLANDKAQLILCAASVHELGLVLANDFRGRVDAVVCEAAEADAKHIAEVGHLLHKFGRSDKQAHFAQARAQGAAYFYMQPFEGGQIALLR